MEAGGLVGSTVIDFAAGPPSAKAIKAAGHEGVVRYISPARESWMTGKPATREQLDAYDEQGLKFAFVWQYGGAHNPDAMRGAEGGRADARAARAKLDELGCAGHPVFFAVDFDCTLDQWNSVVAEYFKGAVSVLGRQRVGIYAHSRALAWAAEDGVVATVDHQRILGWQTTSWSHGEIAPEAVLIQDRHNVPGPDGVQVDVSAVEHAEWGWRTPPTIERPADDPGIMRSWRDLKPAVLAPLPPGHHYWRGRGGKRVEMVVVHHNAGVNSTSSVRDVWIRREASAHYQVETSGRVGQIVADSDTAWHAANSDINQRSIGIEVSNSGGAQQDWPISDAAVESAAHLIAAVCAHFQLGPPQVGRNVRFHREFTTTTCPLHLAPGGKYHHTLMTRAAYWYPRIGTENNQLTEAEMDEIIARLETIETQLLGPTGGPAGGRGWQQLGQNSAGQNLTVVDAISALRHQVAAQQDTINEIKENL